VRGRNKSHTQASDGEDVIASTIFLDLDTESRQVGINQMTGTDSIFNLYDIE
jgi:hypothetical protein